jgi:hypothetical protein
MDNPEKLDSRYLSFHIFLIAVKSRDLGGISPVIIMVNHINKFPHPSCVDVHLVKPKVNIYQTKITLATFVYHVYVLLLHAPKDVKNIWFYNLSSLSIPDEGYSRHALCALN